MKNITDFNKFKKLNEVVDQRAGTYGGGGDTYFANVKGNFAGADQTLIGSAVIKLFRFVKRKGYQVLLYTWFKPNLYREYMSGLLRYIIRNGMSLPKEKILYDATYTHNVEKQKLETEEKLKIKFLAAASGTTEVSGSTEKPYSVSVGALVKNEADQDVKDGYYQLTTIGRIIKVVDSKLVEIDARLSDDPIDVPEEEEVKPEDVGMPMDKDIEQYIKQIREEYNKSTGEVKPEIINKSVKEIDEFITFFNANIAEMDDMLKDNTTENDVIARVKKDRETYLANIKGLTNLKNEINKKGKPAPVADGDEKVKKPAEMATASFNYVDDNILNEEVDIAGAGGDVKNFARNAGQIKVGDQKVTKSKRIGDELNQLSKVDIDLNDPEFVKQFDDETKKKECTNVVLEGKSEICKIQLGAERLYMHADEKGSLVPDAKLQNNWLKMVQTIKNQFSRFMLVDVVDPVVLRNKLGTDEVKNLGGGTTGTIGVVKDIEGAMKVSKNKNLNALLVCPGGFKKEGNMGITIINDEQIVYAVNKIGISGHTYYTYRIVATVSSGMTDDQTSTSFENYIKKDVNSFPALFKPVTAKLNGNFTHLATFIIGKERHLDQNDNNNVNILYVYSNDLSLKTIENQTDYQKCLFFFRKNGTTPKDQEIKSAAASVDPDSVVKVRVTNPWEIKPSSINKFGFDQSATSFSINYLGTKNLVQLKK